MIFLQQGRNIVPDPPSHLGIVHCVQMDTFHTIGNKVHDLIHSVSDAGVPKGFRAITVAAHHPAELGGKAGSAEGNHPFDLPFVDHRHDTRFDGNVDPCNTGPLHKGIKEVVIKEQLADQVFRPGVHLFAQVEHIGDQIGALTMSFRIAGRGDVKISLLFDKGNQFRSVMKICVGRNVGIDISPESEDIGDFRCFQVLQQEEISWRL